MFGVGDVGERSKIFQRVKRFKGGLGKSRSKPAACGKCSGGYIAMLAVEKELRGRRIGSKLVKLCLDRMRLSDCTTAFLVCNEEAAVAFQIPAKPFTQAAGCRRVRAGDRATSLTLRC